MSASAYSASGTTYGGYVTTRYTMQEGLPENTVYQVTQTHDGYIWVGTQEGLARFDGVHFTTFTTRNSRGLISNNIHQLVEDKSGNLWIWANSGLCRYRDGVFTDMTPPWVKEGDRIWDIRLGIHGNLLIGGDDRFYEYKDGKFNVLFFSRQFFHKPRGWTSFRQAPDGNLIVGSPTGSIVCAGRSPARELSSGLAFKTVYAWPDNIDNRGNLWITTGAGLMREHAGGLQLVLPAARSHGPAAWATPDAEGNIWFIATGKVYELKSDLRTLLNFPIPTIMARILRDAYGAIWFVSDSSSTSTLYRIINGRAVRCLELASKMMSSWGSSFCADHEGNVWVGTNAGLHCVKQAAWRTLDRRDGLPDDQINSVYQDKAGIVWVGTDNSGLYRAVSPTLPSILTEHGRSFIPCSYPELRKGRVRSLVQDRHGDLWVNQDGRLIRCDGTRAVDCTASLNLPPEDQGVMSLAVDTTGRLWVGTDRQVIQYDGAVRARYTAGHGLPDDFNQAIVIIPDTSGNIWIGMQVGALLFRDGRYHEYRQTDGLPTVPIIDIVPEPSGETWFASWGDGIYRLKNGSISHIGVNNGLYADSVHRIIERGDDLWIATVRGVFRAHKSELEQYLDHKSSSFQCVTYGPADGASAGQCVAGWQPTACQTRDGTLWFPGYNGLATYRPYETATLPVKVIIESVDANAKSIKVRRDSTIPPGEGSLTVKFTAIEYAAPQNLRLYYRLKGFDKNWILDDGRRTAHYTNLPPGLYSFNVRAAMDGAAWPPVEAAISLDLAPHYYQTMWFKLICAVCALAAVWFLFRIRMRRLAEQNRSLELAVALRTEELKAAHEELLAQNDELQAMHAELEEQNQELIETKSWLTEANTRLEALATTDGLTGLKNHRTFQEKLAEECARARRNGSKLSVIFTDVDYFKAYNDKFGHPAGDEVLRSVGRILKEVVRESDVAARYGGEEFALILPDADVAGATVIAERLRKTVETTEFPHRQITLSIGVATISPDAEEPAQLIAQADEALYAAKNGGRNRVMHHRTIGTLRPAA